MLEGQRVHHPHDHRGGSVFGDSAVRDRQRDHVRQDPCRLHGGLQPVKYLKWIPDYVDPGNWHREGVAENTNLTMILSMSGIIHPLTDESGREVPFPAIHFVAGGVWDAPTLGGHLEKGSRVKGMLECFITEINDLERLPPVVRVYDDDEYPENWYTSLL